MKGKEAHAEVFAHQRIRCDGAVSKTHKFTQARISNGVEPRFGRNSVRNAV